MNKLKENSKKSTSSDYRFATSFATSSHSLKVTFPNSRPQVMETHLKKRMEQVKELYADSTDVFEELIAVKKHLSEQMAECQVAIEKTQASVSQVIMSEPQANTPIQVQTQ